MKRKQAELQLDRLAKSLGVSNVALAKTLFMHPDQVSRLRRNEWSEISKDELLRLVRWARTEASNNPESVPALFALEPHAVWQTFSDASATIFVARDDVDDHSDPADQNAAAALNSFLKDEVKCVASLKWLTMPAIGDDTSGLISAVTDAMRTENCIFVGGPNHNPGTEVAVAALWGALPFKSEATEPGVPFRVSFADWPEGKEGSCFASHDPHVRKLTVMRPRFHEYKLPFLAEQEWLISKSGGVDYATFVLCRRPLNTDANVATVIVFGLTGYSTYQAALGLIQDELHIPQTDVRDRAPLVRILHAHFKKRTNAKHPDPARGSRWYEAARGRQSRRVGAHSRANA